MVYFGDRKKLNEMYKDFIIKADIPDTSFNCITYLQELLDEEKVKEFLGE